MYKDDVALNNLQWLICHETRPNKQTYNLKLLFGYNLKFNENILKKILHVQFSV